MATGAIYDKAKARLPFHMPVSTLHPSQSPRTRVKQG